MIKVQYISDIHLEKTLNDDYWFDHRIEVVGDILVLAGDIIHINDFNWNHPFFDRISEDFEQVFMIPGNHEYYDTNDSSLIKKDSLDIDIRHNVKLYNNKSINYKGVNFIFTTLWSHIQPQNVVPVMLGVACFSHIKYGKNNINTIEWNDLHAYSKFFLMNALADIKEGKTIVVTHHIPTSLCVTPEHRVSSINSAFATELYDIIHDSNIDYWIYGHSHRNMDEVEINNTKLVCNQFGYVQFGDQETFNETKTIKH